MSRCEVLVVDDLEDCRLILRAMLEAQGCIVRLAGSGQQALREIDARAPDVVILDLMMPDMSGLDVLERIRSDPARTRLPVIMVTARADDDHLLLGYQHGADYYITKPCTARQLMTGIGLVLGDAQQEAAFS